jgi:hypothetical protein
MCKICEWSKDSFIFGRRNVWLCNVLKELEQYRGGKIPMNTKYEIVNLTKELGFDKMPVDNPEPRKDDSFVDTRVQPPQAKDQLNIENLPAYVTVDESNFGPLPEGFNLRSIIA